MIRKFWRRVSWPIVFAGLTAPFIANCGSLPKVPGGGGMPGVPGGGNCPDMAKIEAIESFDFGKEFNLKADVAAKIKGGVCGGRRDAGAQREDRRRPQDRVRQPRTRPRRDG